MVVREKPVAVSGQRLVCGADPKVGEGTGPGGVVVIVVVCGIPSQVNADQSPWRKPAHSASTRLAATVQSTAASQTAPTHSGAAPDRASTKLAASAERGAARIHGAPWQANAVRVSRACGSVRGMAAVSGGLNERRDRWRPAGTMRSQRTLRSARTLLTARTRRAARSQPPAEHLRRAAPAAGIKCDVRHRQRAALAVRRTPAGLAHDAAGPGHRAARRGLGQRATV